MSTTISKPTTREMQKAYLKRDESYDGVFYLAVRTTGIFCRPSCPARKPLPKNVTYFASTREALFAGFRPCKRCRPMEANGRPPEWVNKLLARIDEDSSRRLTDGDIRKLGIDSARARRYFLKHHGMTFQAYCRARRMGTALDQIRRGADLDEVALGNGYDSHSGFREAFMHTFGKSPGQSRNADCVVITWVESPVGPLLAGANREGICLLEFTDRRMLETQFDVLRKRLDCAIVPGENEHLIKLRKELGDYFAGELRDFTVPLVYPGTPFQKQVWDELLKIPYGRTRSYEEMATRIGHPGAQRAVGTANGCNRIAIVIPCHRVVNKGGKLGGYGGGLWRKQMLLDLEQGKSGLRTLFEESARAPHASENGHNCSPLQSRAR
ncbi:MAG: bifunctional transcriptional activator/DNA repair protein Ada [Planctomycetes bacterium]|nr:bifunctional transcriptional activator/DNA repair protein Ada [Planctomycetota bacterium]